MVLSLSVDAFISAPIKLAALIDMRRKGYKINEANDNPITSNGAHQKQDKAQVQRRLNRMMPRINKNSSLMQPHFTSNNLVPNLCKANLLLLLMLLLSCACSMIMCKNTHEYKLQPQNNYNGPSLRHKAHYMNIIPSSHFNYNEGRQLSHVASSSVEQASAEERSANSDNNQDQKYPENFVPQTSHIYKRSSALISRGSHYPALISSLTPAVGNHLNPLSRRMMSEVQNRWTSPLMVLSNNEQPPNPLAADEQQLVELMQLNNGGNHDLTPSASNIMEVAQVPSITLNNNNKRRREEELLKQKQHIQYHDQWPSLAGKCHKRTLNFCASVLPFNTTTFPNIIGDTNRFEVKRSLPFFGFLAKSSCNKRLDELLCLLLEPPCSINSGLAIPPCKKFCRLALEGCNEYIPATLAMSSVFDCRQYPDSNDPNVCINLAQGSKCAQDEFKCPDKTCIPRNWLCDGVRDCIFAADEANCTAPTGIGLQSSVCSTEEFKCDGKCVPKAWKCDGERDCLDGTDEESCDQRPRCGPDRFRCADGNGCLPKRWVCDGKAECRDGSDEMNCEQLECSENDFKCDNGICIPKLWRCDKQFDCKDGSDERSCVYPTSTSTTLAPLTTTTLSNINVTTTAAAADKPHINSTQLSLQSVERQTQTREQNLVFIEDEQTLSKAAASPIDYQPSQAMLSAEQAAQHSPQRQQQLLMNPMNFYASGPEQSSSSKQQLESSLNDDISRIIQQEISSSSSSTSPSLSSSTSSSSSFSLSSSSSSSSSTPATSQLEVQTEPATLASQGDTQLSASTLIPVTDNQEQRQQQQQPTVVAKELKKFDYDIIQSTSLQPSLTQLNELTSELQPSVVNNQMVNNRQQQLMQTQIDFVPHNGRHPPAASVPTSGQLNSISAQQQHQLTTNQHAERTLRENTGFDRVAMKSSSTAPQIALEQAQEANDKVISNERVPIYRSLFKSLKGNQNRGSTVNSQSSDGNHSSAQQHRYSIVGRRRRDRHQHNQQRHQQQYQQQSIQPQQVSAAQQQELFRAASSIAPNEQQATVMPIIYHQPVQVNQTNLKNRPQQSHGSVSSYLQLLNNRYNLRLTHLSSGA